MSRMPAASSSSSMSSRIARRDHPEHVLDVEPAPQRRLDLDPAGPEAAARRTHLEPFGPDLGSVGEAERDQRRAARLDELERQPAAVLVAHVHRRRRRLGAREQAALRLVVVLHRPVQVEVILREVREDERVEAHPVEPVQRRAVGRGLDGDASIARVEHLAEQALQVDRLGRRVRRRRAPRHRRPSRRCRRAPVSGLRPRGRSGAGTSRSSCRSFPSRRRPRARASARRRRHRRRSPSTHARPRRRAAARRARAGARRRGRRRPPPRPRRAKSCPSAREPGTQKNTAPGVTRRASYARSVTSTAPRAVLSPAASTRVRSSRSTEPHSTAGCRSARPVAVQPDPDRGAQTGRATGPWWRWSASRARPAAPRDTGDRTARCP